MKPLLTTITVYWNREPMLERWLRAVDGARIDGLTEHLLLYVNDHPKRAVLPAWLRCVGCQGKFWESIGHYQNIAASLADTEWIMKLDVDALPNLAYFHSLVPVLVKAERRQWFNGGMIYVNQRCSASMLSEMPLSLEVYSQVMKDVSACSSCSYPLPQATNWICRKADYLWLGGCDERFRGYGWEDYQQIYMLEKCQQGKDPLPGDLTLDNVTRRCRDEIARPKALQLYAMSPWLSLLHCWHPMSTQNGYRSFINQNRQVLLNWIQKARTE